jgi:REP element-mobilizing transposase RayT
MCRGNNRQSIFKADKGRRLFLSTLEEVCHQTGWWIHAYVLMSNHYHLLLETPEANLVAGMKWFQGTYTQRFNAMFNCCGHLFQGRYKALPIETDRNGAYFRSVANYIHLNPFRAGLAGIGMNQPLEEYRWSSYPAYIGQSRTIPCWLKLERLLSGQSPNVQSEYHALLEYRMMGQSGSGSLDEQVEKQLKRGWFVGGESFRERLTDQLPSQSDNLRGAQRAAHDEKEAERLLESALEVLHLSEAELLSLKNTRVEKQAVVWLLKKHTAIEVAWLAQRLAMGHRTNASRAISRFNCSADPEQIELKRKMLQITG